MVLSALERVRGVSKFKETYTKEEVRAGLKWIGEKCKEVQKELDETHSCWQEKQMALRYKLDGMVEIKVGLEKYYKKLKHEQDRATNEHKGSVN